MILFTILFHFKSNFKSLSNKIKDSKKNAKKNVLGSDKYVILEINNKDFSKIDLKLLKRFIKDKKYQAILFNYDELKCEGGKNIYKVLNILNEVKTNGKTSIFIYSSSSPEQSLNYFTGGFFDILFLNGKEDDLSISLDLPFYSSDRFLKKHNITYYNFQSNNNKVYKHSNNIEKSKEYQDSTYKRILDYRIIFLKNIAKKRNIKYENLIKIIESSISSDYALKMNLIDGIGQKYELENYILNKKLTNKKIVFFDISDQVVRYDYAKIREKKMKNLIISIAGGISLILLILIKKLISLIMTFLLWIVVWKKF